MAGTGPWGRQSGNNGVGQYDILGLACQIGLFAERGAHAVKLNIPYLILLWLVFASTYSVYLQTELAITTAGPA